MHTLTILAMGYFFGVGLSNIMAMIFDDAYPIQTGIMALIAIALIECGLFYLAA